MNRIVLPVVALTLASGCAGAARSVVLPVSMEAPLATATIETGAKQRTRVFDFEIPRVAASRQKGFVFKLGPVTLNKGRTSQERKFTIERSGSPFITDVNCMSVNQEQREGLLVYYRHSYTCSSPSGFELQVDQTSQALFNGTVKYGGVALEVVSTIDFTDGKQGWSPAGFHLRRDGRWLGTFEYFKDGKAYLAPDLAPEEHAAVLAAVVSISSTGRWFQLNPDGTTGKRAGF